MPRPDESAMSQALGGVVEARTIAFTARTWISRYEDTGQPSRFLMPGQAFLVRAKRPGCLYIREDRADPVMKKAIEAAGMCAGTPFDVFITDGKRQLVMSSTSRVHQERAALPTIADVDQHRGLAAQLGADVLFGAKPLRNFRHVGCQALEEETADVYERAQSRFGRQSDSQRLYLSNTSSLPLRISLLQAVRRDEPIEYFRADFSDWRLEVEIPDRVFDPTPPADSLTEPPPLPSYDPCLRPGTAPAPFDAVDMDGRPVRLEDYRGKVLVLDYWATWCQPCRSEMLNLKEVYERYHEKGVEVISISLDQESLKDRMVSFLAHYGFPWRHVWDGLGFESPLATAYKVNAIPFILLIGRDGKIAAVNPRGHRLVSEIRRALD